MESQAITTSESLRPRIWSSKQVLWGTMIGGYLSGFYLLNDNYKALGQSKLAMKALLAGVISTLAFFAIILFLPEDVFKQYRFFLLLAQGFLAGGYLLNEHYKAFYSWNLFWKSLIYTALLTTALLTIPAYLPEKAFEYIPNMMLFLIPGLLVNGFAQSYQDQHLKVLVENGAQKNSNYKLIGIAILAILFQFAIVCTAILLTYFIYD